jgi:alanyl-tRNA synthetase
MTTPNVRHKEILRQLIRRIVMQAQGQSEQVKLLIEWTQQVIGQFVACYKQLNSYSQLCQCIPWSVEQGFDATSIAFQLNQEGFCSP